MVFIRVIGRDVIFCGRSVGLCTHLSMSLLFLKKQSDIKAFREKQKRNMCCQTFSLVHVNDSIA